MKSVILSMVALSCGLVSAQPMGRTTDPVGYVKLANTLPGNDAVAAEMDVYLTIPLIRPATIKATVTNVSGSTVSLSSGFSQASLVGPHYFVVESGTKKGLIGTVTSTTATSVVVALDPEESMAGISPGVAVSLRPAWTARNVFAEAIPSGTRICLWTGTQYMYLQPPNIVLEFDGVNWRNVVGSTLANDFILYPTETFMLRTGSNKIPRLSVVGEVPLLPSRINLTNYYYTGKHNFVSFFGAIDEPILSSGVMDVSHDADYIYFFDRHNPGHNKAPIRTLEYFYGFWTDVGSETYIDEYYKFPAGEGIIYYRRGNSPMTPTLWSDFPDYVPVD